MKKEKDEGPVASWTRAKLRAVLFSFFIFQFSFGCAAADGLIASPESGWPQWRGLRRDGVSTETGLLQDWPEGGPKLLWTATDIGKGFSSPIISNRSIYISGDVGPELYVFALDMAGKPKWKSPNGGNWSKPYGGARGSCAYSEGHVYNINAHGRIACFEAATGKEVWAKNALKEFEGQNIMWAISECALIDGPHVIVTPGGNKSFMVALDKKTGALVWVGEPLPEAPAERVGYASPILFELNGRRLIATLSLRSVVCVDAENGKVQCVFQHPTRYNANCATPVYCEGAVFHTNPTGAGGVLLKVLADKESVKFEKLWDCGMDNISGGAIAHAGLIYGSGQQNTGWVCMDAKSGAVKWDSKELAQGALTYADNRLYWLSESGTLALAGATADQFKIHGRIKLTEAPVKDAWAHPVILDGRLYLRYHDKLYCFDVRK